MFLRKALFVAGVALFGCIVFVVLKQTRVYTYEPYVSLPRISWDQVLSGNKKGFLMRLYWFTETLHHTAEGNSFVLSVSDAFYSRYGLGGPRISPRPVSVLGTITYRYVRPYTLLKAYASTVDQKDVVILYVGWKNKDGSRGLLTYIIPREWYESEHIIQRINAFIRQDMLDDMLVPIMRIRDMDMCLQRSEVNTEYCTRFMKQQTQMKIFQDEWVRSGKVPNDLVQYPLLIQ